MNRVATVAQEYAGRKIRPGQTFDVEDAHVNLLLVLGRIKPEDPEEPVVEKSHHDTELQPEQYANRMMPGRGKQQRRRTT